MKDPPAINIIVTKAKSEFNKREYLKSARGFEEAVRVYSSSGNPIKSVEMANNSSVAYLKAGEPGLAFNILKGIEDICKQRGKHRHFATTIGNRGAALEALGKVDEAVEHYRFAAKIFAEIGDDDLHTYTVQAISSIQLSEGHPLQALETMRVGLNKIQNQNRLQKILNYLLDIPTKILIGKSSGRFQN